MKAFGVHRATVVANLDPERRYRLHVHVPDVSDLPVWAEACAPASQVSMPRIGDTVWVMFEAGNVESPVWVGVLPGVG